MPVRNDTRRRHKEDEYYDQDHVPTKDELAYKRRMQQLRQAGLLPGQLRKKGALEEATASYLYLVGKKPDRDGIKNEPIDTAREGNEEVEEEGFDYYVEEKVYNLPKPRWEPHKPKEKKRRYKAD
jgi:hypothetical protein